MHHHSMIMPMETYLLQLQQPTEWNTSTTNNIRNDTEQMDETMIVRCQVQLPYHYENDNSFHTPPTAMILPYSSRYQTSTLLSPIHNIANSDNMMISTPSNRSYSGISKIDDSSIEQVPIVHPYRMTPTSYPPPEIYQALVYFPDTNQNYNPIHEVIDLYPTLAFYTSNPHDHNIQQRSPPTEPSYMDPSHDVVMDDNDNKNDDDDDGILLVSVTKAIVGTAFGALRWGLTRGGGGGTSTSPQRTDSKHPTKHNHSTENRYHEKNPITLVDRRDTTPIALHRSTAFHDLPRSIHFCTIDPDGKLAASADNLGRVLLIDITTQQMIRMWKGFRDATCHWIQQFRDPTNENQSKNRQKRKIQLYILIHSRQRRIVEIWPVRYGDRTSSISVGRDANIIPFSIWTSNGTERVQLAHCCIAQSTVPGSHFNRLEMIHVSNEDSATNAAPINDIPLVPQSPVRSIRKASVATTKLPGTSSRNGALRLKQLQQLLTSTQIQCTIDDIRNALHEITSLVDLTMAIDLLATSPGLEDKLKVDGAVVHEEVVTYCRDAISTILQPDGDLPSDNSLRKNPHVQVLLQKIIYHEQLLKAYDILYKFGTKTYDTSIQQVKSPSHWAAEAMAWASTYEQVTGLGLDDDINAVPQTRIRFTEFASSCKFPDVTPGKTKGSFKIYFSDSSRSRRSILEYVFKPLLGDAFSITRTDSIFEALGIRSDFLYTQVCFAEWFMTLSIRDACKKGIYADLPPMVQFLRALTIQQLLSSGTKESDFALNSIGKFCEESTDLVRSFMLGALCLEAVSKAVTHKDVISITTDVAARSVTNWKSLLRKLRVCLLVALRLHGNQMAAPITIDNINQPDIFSVFEWLALDELTMSHTNEEIVSLEKACSISSYAFDPSLPDGDGPSRFKMIQSSCLAATITEEERAEYLVDINDDDRFGALLLFLSSHNNPKILAAHRALLLVTQWGTNPKSLQLVLDAVVSLTSLSKTNGFKALAAAVCVEIWQSRLCPIYRAYLFGFSDVHELSEDIVSPLIQDADWFAAVGRTGLQLLAILQECKTENPSEFIFELDESVESWPSLRPDFKLQKLIDKMPKQVEESALNIHSVVLCAFLVSSDIKALAQCIPTLHDLFLPFSLFQPMVNSTNVPELQQRYLNNAIITFAVQYTGPALDSFDLGEIMTLAKVWNFNPASVRTIFLLAMYELGKDQTVDELITKASFLIDGNYFVEGGVSIACLRLNVVLNEGRMNSSKIRNAIGVLDAELCEWIKQRASKTVSLVKFPALKIPINSTHLFVMRLLSISASSNVDKELRIRIHSLVVLSGILMKAVSE